MGLETDKKTVIKAMKKHIDLMCRNFFKTLSEKRSLYVFNLSPVAASQFISTNACRGTACRSNIKAPTLRKKLI